MICYDNKNSKKRGGEEINRLVFELVLNIGLLVLVASLLSKIGFLQNLITQERRSWKSQVLLALLFSGIIILSTYTSIDIGVYSLNTRVIGAMAAGILGGPLVGLYASLIGAVYVYLCSEPQMFAVASAFSTALFGLLGGGFYPYFQRGKWKYKDLFFLACFAEICDMIALLRLASPFDVALETVLQIAAPMILLNSVGNLIFISSFNQMFIKQDMESSRQLQVASALSEKCLPLLSKGLHDDEQMKKLAAVILQETDWVGVMITDTERILQWQQTNVDYQPADLQRIPKVGRKAMEQGRLFELYQVPRSSSWHEYMKEYSMVAAPFVIQGKSIGCFIIWMKKQWVFRKSELELVQHLVTIGSLQIAMLELEHQEVLLQKAEFQALQFQVNPHFLFNALNTISCVYREDGEKARELLIRLANYFRYNLDGSLDMVPLSDEINHVKDYLELEKGRFEEKLIITYQIPAVLTIKVPPLIIQPIVENAVRYGIDAQGFRKVEIQIIEDQSKVAVRICDGGKGFSQEILEKLERGEPLGKSIGLTNVQKRMKSTYGKGNGLYIHSSAGGTCVELHFLKEV